VLIQAVVQHFHLLNTLMWFFSSRRKRRCHSYPCFIYWCSCICDVIVVFCSKHLILAVSCFSFVPFVFLRYITQTYSTCRFLLPASLIVINDIAAYLFGFFFGRTPLIKLSPKKTWEGFIGASVATIISAFLVCTVLHLSSHRQFTSSTFWDELKLMWIVDFKATFCKVPLKWIWH